MFMELLKRPCQYKAKYYHAFVFHISLFLSENETTKQKEANIKKRSEYSYGSFACLNKHADVKFSNS